MADMLTPIPDAIGVGDSLPRPNWNAIATWVKSDVELALLNETWAQIARDWLTRLSKALPNGYALFESSEFLVLAADEALGQRVLNSCERARRIILKTLDGVAGDQGYGKHVVLLFAESDSYYDYVADFYPDEGEFGLSGGMFIDDGYGHFVVCPAYDDDYERVIAHELNHALLRHLPLPLWLNEGVTQEMEDVVSDSSYFMVDHEILRRHRCYWNAENIHMFWSGESFLFADDGQELSYHLAYVLFRNLMSDYPGSVNDILNNANFIDAGNAALINACHTSLADRVSQFLGDGEWAPRSEYPSSQAAAN